MCWDGGTAAGASWLAEGDGLGTDVVRLLCRLAGHEGLPDSAISSSLPKVPVYGP